MNKQSFHANGKLLITGEYLVMQGALALAVPTKLGQHMTVAEGNTGSERKGGSGLNWMSYYKEKCWFEGKFSIPDVDILESTDKEKAGFIRKLLATANELNPEVLNDKDGIQVETILEFSPKWGLGSSSTLISMVADWFEIDPYQLFHKVQEGSAYDVACAKSDSPIWYRLVLGSPVIQPVVFYPSFKDKIVFVYSGKKKNSAAAVNTFRKGREADDDAKNRISQLGRDLTSASDLDEFNRLVDEHEHIMSKILVQKKVKDQAFPDFPGSIKSLGAWGGDFLMASSEIGFIEIKSYFSRNGLNVVFSFDELI